MRSETCSRCGEEVRYGVRGTTTGWLHREDGDHVAVLGRIATAEDKARWDAELDVERTRVVTKSKGKGDNKVFWEEEETYTVRALDLERWRKSKKFRAQEEAEAARADEDDDEDEVPDEIPEPEVRRHDVEVDSFPPRSGIRQMVNLVLKTDGWELRRLTHARGPYLGSSGKVLSISDTIVMSARSKVDDGYAIVVCSWRDGAFDTGYTGVIRGGIITPTPATSTAIKAWIKETSP